TYYAAAVTNATQQTYNVGLPAFSQNNPFIIASAGWGLRFAVTNTCNIDSVGVYPIGTGTLSIRIWDANTQAVIYTSPTSPTITGTGVEKKMIYVGALNLAPGSYVLGIGAYTGLSNLRNEGFNASAYPFTSPVLNITAGSQGFGGTGTPYVYYFSYDWKISAIGGCEGTRVPVAATINASTPVAKAAPAVVCNGEIATITLTPPATPYPSYNWSPVANLFTDAAATVPYLGGSATTLYMKTTNVGQQTFYMMAGNPAVTTGCTFADTLRIWSQPPTATLVGAPDSVCIVGNSTISLSPVTGYAPNSIQWQESANGTTYNIVAGATSPSYTTPSLTTEHYYKALVKSTNSTCMTLDKHIVVVNPTLLGAADSFNCGPGTVTLKAATAGYSTAKWYDVPTGGTPVGSGSPWTTPYLGASQTYYVSAEGGAGGGAPITTQVGTATTTYGGTSSSAGPFSIYYRRYSQQYLYTAAEILAAGGNPGNMTSIAFNCTGLPTYAIPNFTIRIKFVPATMTTLTTWQTTGLTDVYTTASLLPTATGWVTFPFTNNQVWNGTDNVVVEVCRSQVQPNWASSGNHQYTTKTGRFLLYNSDDPGSSCGVSGTTTSTYLPNVRFGLQAPCQTPRLPVHAYIHPQPVVDLGNDINQCLDQDEALVLDAGVQPNNPAFLWDNQTTSQVRGVYGSGTYHVTVTNQFTCKGYDTINVIIRKNPVVNLGNDTTVCNGVVLPLNAGGDGINYYWNNGSTTQIINVNSAGNYSVYVTNSLGCSKADTITVNMAGELPTIQGINVNNNGQYTFTFSAINGQNVIEYDWDFGDNTTHAYSAVATHTYAAAGNYVVVLKLKSSCGFGNDSTSAHILGINQLTVGADGVSVFPNPSGGTATIMSSGGLNMKQVALYNVLGQMVYSEKAQSSEKHAMNLDALASGVYTIQITTDKGNVAKKLEIIR
ncbi:MAG: T9SS type A sorting domain-containing protein, partial [Sphingobacteriales bacterium]